MEVESGSSGRKTGTSCEEERDRRKVSSSEKIQIRCENWGIIGLKDDWITRLEKMHRNI